MNREQSTIKVLHLRASNFYGGPERQLHYHAKLAKQSGVEITVSSFTEQNQTPEFLQTIKNDNIRTHLFEVKNAYDSQSVSLIRSFLTENSIDILCTHDYRSHFRGMKACKKTDTAWIAFSRGMTKENLKIRLFTFLEKYVIRKADHLVAVSEAQKNKLIKLSIGPEKIKVVHNAIDESLLDSVEPIDLNEKFQFEQNDIICISGGRFSEEKGQIYLVKAAEIALKQNKKLRFVLFGDGPDLEKIKKYISNRGLTYSIICPGFEKNLLGHLKSADILINPSLSEGLPNIVLEALAAGVPVIATDVGGLPEIIQDGHNGFLVEAKNIQQLADKIIALAGNKEMIKSFSENGRHTIKERFNFESQNKKLISLYNQIVNNK